MDTTLHPSLYAKEHQKDRPTPAHLGGFQALADDAEVIDGDLIVFTDGTTRKAEWADHPVLELTCRVEEVRSNFPMRSSIAVYRKIPVAKQGDSDERTQAMIASVSAAPETTVFPIASDIRVKTEAQRRKGIPVFSGFLAYFPDAVRAVAELSRIGNDQHNPGKPLHWDRSKSGDELDALGRHLLDTIDGLPDTDDVLHETKVAWRAMANLQKRLEAQKSKPSGPTT